MFTNNKISKIAAAVALSVGLSTAAMAQETSSAMEGRVVGPGGQSAAGTIVTVVHVPSGTSRQVTVSENGTFTMRGLRVGGPYQIIADSNVFQDTTVDGVFLNLGEAFDVNLQLENASDVEVISINASAISTSAFGSTGPQSIFSLEDLQNAPAINRDINDIVRADPRIFIDESFNDAIRCGGGNPRFNSLTLDGVRMNDSFGLNSNGYPTTRMPFSFDAIQEVAVELAPFDVQYGGFTSCNINAVTKSGTNEISGGAFYDFTSDSFRGDKLDGQDVDNGNYTEKRYGVNVGFPIIKDKLFFYTAYEKVEGVQLFSYGPLQAGSDTPITQAEVDRITSIASSVYNYDVGGFPGSQPITDEKLLVKLDWNITDGHRLSLLHNYNDGFSISQSDADPDELSFSNHFYERGAELTSTVLSVYSSWSDNFDTELRLGSTELQNRQLAQDAASGFGEVQIDVGDAVAYLGIDDSRQANRLNWDMVNFKLAGTYYTGEHTITAGIEYEKLDIFNLFMQHTIGQYEFNSIDDFEAGIVNGFDYNNSAGTNNPDDAGASFSYDVTTLYIQDDFYLTDDIQIMLGLRYDKWSTDDEPRFNQNFAARYGFFNTNTVDGIDLLQPRVGMNWAVNDQMEVRAGVGLYSGGNPNVWISNAYSNDGLTNIGVNERSPGIGRDLELFNIPLSGEGRPIRDVPQAAFDIVANTSTTSGDGGVVAADPDFEIPSEWKYALGMTYITDSEYVITADYIFTNKENSAVYRDANLTFVGATTGLAGRVIPGFVDPGRGVGRDFVLGNAETGDGKSHVVSIAIAKEWENGIDATLGYAYVESEDANPMTSSVAGSNYTNFAATFTNQPDVATSDYEIPHRLTLTLGYATEFFDGYETRFSLFGTASDGEATSYLMGNPRPSRDRGDAGFSQAFTWDSARNGRQLLYVPEGDGSDNVVFEDANDSADFFAWAEAQGLERGETVRRNSANAPWWIKADVRVSQEFPAFSKDHQASAFLVIENFTNLLNDEWGDYRQGGFVGSRVIDVDINSDGEYVYRNFREAGTSISRGPSLWEVRIGVNYKF